MSPTCSQFGPTDRLDWHRWAYRHVDHHLRRLGLKSTQANEIDGVLTFLGPAERLKTVTRSGWTSTGEQERVAEDTWRLYLMARLLYGRTPGIDLARLLRMCLIHDLGEAMGGDVPAPAQQAGLPKADRGRADLLELTAALPAALRHEIVELWHEYEAAGWPDTRRGDRRRAKESGALPGRD